MAGDGPARLPRGGGAPAAGAGRDRLALDRGAPASRPGGGCPGSCTGSGVALLPRQPDVARERLRDALAAFEEREDAAGAWLSWAAVVESVVLEWKDLRVLGPALADHERLSARFPYPSPEVEARVALGAFTAASLHRPDHPSYEGWARAVRGLALGAQDPAIRLSAGALLVSHEALVLGEIERNRPVVEALERLARDPNAPGPAVILWLSAVGTFHFTAGDLEGCAASAAKALEASRRHGLHAWDFVSRMLEATVAISREDRDVSDWLAAAERAVHPDSQIDLANLRVAQGFAALRAGRPAAAVALADEAIARAQGCGYPMPEVLAMLLLARARARTGDRDGAAGIVAVLQQIAEAVGSVRARSFAAFIDADLQVDGAGRAAALATAFRLVRESGAPPLLLFSRTELSGLAAAALAHGVPPEDVHAFIRARRLDPPQVLEVPERWPWPFRIRVLGGFEVERDGAPWTAGRRAPRKRVELLQALAVLGGRDVPEHALAEALWPDSDGDAAQHALETTLYRLRRTIGRSSSSSGSGGSRSRPDRCGVDALHLEARLRTSLAALALPGGPSPERVSADAAAVVFAVPRSAPPRAGRRPLGGPGPARGSGGGWSAGSRRSRRPRATPATRRRSGRRSARRTRSCAPRRPARAG